MDTKEQLVLAIKEWLHIENAYKIKQNEIKALKDRQKELSNKLITTMRENKIECFNTSECKLQYKTTSVKQSLSKKSLLQILEKYFNGQTEKATEMSNFIMENRESKTKETIHQKWVKLDESNNEK